jgi:hypothetical protein
MNIFSLWDICTKYFRKARNVIILKENQMIPIGPDSFRDFFVVYGEPIRIQNTQFRMALSHSNDPHITKCLARNDDEI